MPIDKFAGKPLGNAESFAELSDKLVESPELKAFVSNWIQSQAYKSELAFTKLNDTEPMDFKRRGGHVVKIGDRADAVTTKPWLDAICWHHSKTELEVAGAGTEVEVALDVKLETHGFYDGLRVTIPRGLDGWYLLSLQVGLATGDLATGGFDSSYIIYTIKVNDVVAARYAKVNSATAGYQPEDRAAHVGPVLRYLQSGDSLSIHATHNVLDGANPETSTMDFDFYGGFMGLGSGRYEAVAGGGEG